MNALEVRNLSVRFPGRKKPAITDMSCALRSGELVVLSGPSGSGKSTLLHAVMGYIPEGIAADVDGEILLGGKEAPPGLLARAGKLGLVQQDPEAGICTLRVRDELAFGLENRQVPPAEIADRVCGALAVAGISHLAHRATWTLSGGEKQRTALAAVLTLEPSVLLLDEPTAHLDPPSARGLLALLRTQVTGAQGILLVEHRLGPLRPLRPRVLRLGDAIRAVHAAPSVSPPRSPPAGPPVLAIRLLRFGYPGARELFGGLSLEVSPGEIVGVIGPNGTGKSALLRLLAGLARPLSGEIRVGGHDPAALAPADRRRLVGMVFQMPHHQLFASTVAEEFTLGGLRADEAAKHLEPAGLGGMMEEHPLRLSIGERRRLTVALALAQSPRLLLLDEPFIGQDERNAEWIAGQIRSAAREGTAVVVVSHRLPLVSRLADRVLFLGEVPLLGPAGEVFTELERRGQEVFTPGYWEEEW